MSVPSSIRGGCIHPHQGLQADIARKKLLEVVIGIDISLERPRLCGILGETRDD